MASIKRPPRSDPCRKRKNALHGRAFFLCLFLHREPRIIIAEGLRLPVQRHNAVGQRLTTEYKPFAFRHFPHRLHLLCRDREIIIDPQNGMDAMSSGDQHRLWHSGKCRRIAALHTVSDLHLLRGDPVSLRKRFRQKQGRIRKRDGITLFRIGQRRLPGRSAFARHEKRTPVKPGPGAKRRFHPACRHLLTYVSGLNATTAKNIVLYREQNGPFRSRAELKKVPRLGPATFVQCAGFLRIPDAKNPLDNSAVHPESYDIVKRMAEDKGCTVQQLIADKDLQKTIKLDRYVTPAVGMPTLTDIMAELQRPGRDPRAAVEVFEFDPRVHEIGDLQVGMLLPGIVTNITNFGAFVDVGVHQDGLVHISQLADRYVKDPNDVVKLHQHVVVRVTEVDCKRQRISLSMKE